MPIKEIEDKLYVKWFLHLEPLSVKGSIMPAMPRMKSKATKIAYKILGEPLNLQRKRTPSEKKVNKRLIFEETTRSR